MMKPNLDFSEEMEVLSSEHTIKILSIFISFSHFKIVYPIPFLSKCNHLFYDPFLKDTMSIKKDDCRFQVFGDFVDGKTVGLAVRNM